MIIISHVVALSNNRVIGVNNDLPWRLKKDLAHFKAYTTNKIIIMGEKLLNLLVDLYQIELILLFQLLLQK